MEKVPIYLQWFLFRIHKHGGEKDYLVERFKDMSRDKMLIETQMLGDLHKRGLILLTDKKLNKVFNPLVYTDDNGAVITRAGTEHNVPYHTWFVISPAGKYLWIESILGASGTIAWTIAVAAISGFIGSRVA